jgi:hypothetical protein
MCDLRVHTHTIHTGTDTGLAGSLQYVQFESSKRENLAENFFRVEQSNDVCDLTWHEL